MQMLISTFSENSNSYPQQQSRAGKGSNIQEEVPTSYEAAWNLLKGADGILVHGGFEDRGVQGKILAAKYARENNIPCLGICLGMQSAVIEYARSVLNMHDANSTEFDPNTRSPCVIFMPEGSKTHMGGTMRLGSRTYFQGADCKSTKLYGNVSYIDERHRHKYEELGVISKQR